MFKQMVLSPDLAGLLSLALLVLDLAGLLSLALLVLDLCLQDKQKKNGVKAWC